MPFKQKLNKDTKELEHEKFPACFLADTEDEALSLMKSFDYTLNLLAYKYARITGLSEDDLKQEALIGLARANRDFDVERSEQFKVFAIYKMKDALNEYVADQATNIAVPQYLVSATSLISKMYRFLIMFSIDTNGGYVDIWRKSNAALTPDGLEALMTDENKEIVQKAKREITEVISSLENLSQNACTTVEQLLERAESLPTMANGEDVFAAFDEESVGDVGSTENGIVNSITISVLINKIKELIPKDDYELLVAHYVECKTLRELEKDLGIKAPSIAVRLQKIVENVRKRMAKDEFAEEFRAP